MIDRTDFNLNSTVEGFWTCLTDRIGAGSFDTPEIDNPAKNRWGLFFARRDSPIAREIRSEIGLAKASLLEALQGAEAVPDMVQKSLFTVSDTDFGLGFGKLQHSMSDELMKYQAKALGIRPRQLPAHGLPQPRRLPVCFPAPLRLPVALGAFPGDFSPTGYSAHYFWIAPGGSSSHRWI